MPAPILATKLYIPPPRAAVVPRRRLIERLDEGLGRGCKLTLVSASAGFGKTTLVSEWVAQCARPVAWLALDEGDNDLTRFMTYLAAALQTVAAESGNAALAMLQAPQPPPSEAILIPLLNEIAALPEPFVLALDDYHVIDSQAVDQAVTFLIEHQPRQMHLVIATRQDPALPLARLRARGQLSELRAADLRFTPSEAAEFLNQVMRLDLSAEDIAALEARTEGWIAGLQLAAISMQGRPDTASFIQAFTGSHHFVLDFLIEEVLGQQSESVQAFLLRTSILERMCASLCEAILPGIQGVKTLELLEHANLFIIALDDQRRWYRYHHLFADLLRQRLGQDLPSGEIHTLHLRASEWYEHNGLMLEAFQHALAAEEFERAARLAEDTWQGMERTFQSAAWLGWAKKIPSAVVYARPGLCVQLGEAFSDSGDLETSEIYLQHAEQALVGTEAAEETISLHATIALIRANNAQNQGDLAGSIKYAERILQLAPEDNIYLRAAAVITLEFTHWTAGDVEAALRGMHAWIEDMQSLGNEVFVVASAFGVADLQVILGRLADAESALRQAIQQAARVGPEAVNITAHHHLGLAMIAHERGDAAALDQHLQAAADLGRRTTLVDWQYRWALAQARLKESAGEWGAALELLDEAQRVYVKNPVPILRPIAARQARIYLRQGRLEKAQAWVRERGISTQDEVRYLGEYEQLTLARVRLAEGRFDGVNGLLERLLALAERQERRESMIEILLTQALAYQAQSERRSALLALESALALAQPEGFLRTFVDEGETMRSLLLSYRSGNENQAHPDLHSYADEILAAFSQPGRNSSQARRTAQAPALIEPLTDRELEILRLIAEGKSNAEVSQRLYLALSTVKGHNLRIFHKLQVQNRTEAVSRARELGLL